MHLCIFILTLNSELNASHMKTSDMILLVLAIAPIAGMLLTAIFGRGSRHLVRNVIGRSKTSYLYVFANSFLTIT